ncbi:L-type lectin-domain containing protein [Paenibacillus septentrionalis]|uniref:L-type lectin-domain containing protein n=1 Tax=Paenibacillus septentrionalis TaxID=429342 RepID=UPI003638CABB
MYTARSRTKTWHRFIIFTLALMLIIGTLPANLIYAAEGDETPSTGSNAGLKWLTYKFDLNDFSDPAQQALFQLNGNAAFADGKLMVTPKLASQTGSVFNRQSIQAHDYFSFSTGFSFRMDGNPPNTADGMTFAIVADPTNLGSFGGGLGLAGVKPSLGIKFDAYLNNYADFAYRDPSNNYVGIAYNGNMINSNPDWYYDLGTTQPGNPEPKFKLTSGDVYYAWIDYDGVSSNIKVYFNDSPSKPTEPLINAEGISLKDIFGDANEIYAGFTGSTSGYYESHEILSWYFVNDFAPIGDLNDTSGYRQTPSSVDLKAERASEVGKYKVAVTAKNADGSSAAEVPIVMTSSKSGVWTDETGIVITDWSKMLTNAEGLLEVYFTPDDPSTISDLRAVAVGGAIATGEAPATSIAPGGVEGAALWLKASDDVEVGSDGKVTTWTDQTTGKVFTTDSNSKGVTLDSNLANFNPTVRFDGNGKLNGGADSAIKVLDIFTVAKFINNQQGTIFSSKNQLSNLQGFFRNHGNGPLVQFPDSSGSSGTAREFYAPDQRENDALKQLSASATLGTAWENGVAGASKAPVDVGSFELKLGASDRDILFLNGHFPELIVFDDNKVWTQNERNQINSYLALKYGVTLKADGGSATDYLASDGTTKMWTAEDNAGYGYRITGIGRDDSSALNQKQSKSADVDALVTIALGNKVEASNAENLNEIEADKAFLTFSDNNGSVEYDQAVSIPGTSSDLKRMARGFKVEKTANWVETEITLQLDDVEEGFNYYLLVDNKTTKLDASGLVTLNSAQLADGAIITFVRAEQKVAPGGVSDGLISWVDVGKSAIKNAENNNITSLQDLAGARTWDATNTIGQPYKASTINFNPGVTINSGSGYYSTSAFATDNLEREIFSVQARAHYQNSKAFPWEFGSRYDSAKYGDKSQIITSAFSGSSRIINIDPSEYDLLKSRVLNIRSSNEEWALSLDGRQLLADTENEVQMQFAGLSSYYIGAGHFSRFDGSISEVILFNRVLTENERQQVNSYMALKYGLTLATDYLDSGSGTMWTTEDSANYGNRITGIGRDNNGALYQKQSVSQEVGANVTIALGDSVENSNEELLRSLLFLP